MDQGVRGLHPPDQGKAPWIGFADCSSDSAEERPASLIRFPWGPKREANRYHEMRAGQPGSRGAVVRTVLGSSVPV